MHCLSHANVGTGRWAHCAGLYWLGLHPQTFKKLLTCNKTTRENTREKTPFLLFLKCSTVENSNVLIN